MADTEQAPEGEGAPVPESRIKKMLPILLVVAGGLIFGGASGFFIAGPAIAAKVVVHAPTGTAAATAETVAEPESASGGEGAKVFLLDNMVLNPAGSTGQRFLLVSIALRLKDATIEAELKARDAEVRDVLLRVLGAKHVEELSDISQRDRIKEELRVALNAIIKPGSVRGLYFPQFVIQ